MHGERVKTDKNYIYWMCVCSHRYSAWNAHAPYKIFTHYLI